MSKTESNPDAELKDGHVWVSGSLGDCFHTTRCVSVQNADAPTQVPEQTIHHREHCDFCTGDVSNENKGNCGRALTARLRGMDAAEVFDDDSA